MNTEDRVPTPIFATHEFPEVKANRHQRRAVKALAKRKVRKAKPVVLEYHDKVGNLVATETLHDDATETLHDDATTAATKILQQEATESANKEMIGELPGSPTDIKVQEGLDE